MNAETGSAVTGDACGTGGCDSCTFGCAPAPPRTDTDGAATLAASGVAIALLAGVLAVTGAGWVAAVAGLAATAGAGLAALGVGALVRADRGGDRILALGVRLLPWATAALLLALLARAGSFLLR